MNRNNLGATAGMFLSVFSTAVSAADFSFDRVIPSWFSYSYAEIEYVDMDDGFGGLLAGVSFDIKPNWNVMGQYLFASRSRYGVDLDYKVVSIGGGYHYQLKNFEKSDLMFHASLMQGSAGQTAQQNFKNEEDDNGIRLGVRLRFEPQPDFEVNADISYNSLFDNDLTFSPGALYKINPRFEVKCSFEFGDLDMLSIGVRYYIR